MSLHLSEDETPIALQIIEICHRLNARNMLAAADGNISYRLTDERILITPSGLNKAFITTEDLALITIDNKVLAGDPSTERLMHLEIYKKCPDAKCVVHAHPPTAIAWSLAHPDLKELPFEALPEVILAVGGVPIVPYARPGTIEMGTSLHPFLPQHRVLILARHGGLSWGESLMEGYNGMERLEHAAQILKLATDLGGLTPLPASEIQALRTLRSKMGGRTL